MNEARGFRLDDAADQMAAENEGQWHELRGPDGDVLQYMDGEEIKPVRHLVVGSYSDTFRAARREAERKVTERARQSGTPSTPEEREALTNEALSACVRAWEGFFGPDGEPLECTKKNVLAFISQVPWYADQVTVHTEDHAGFSKPN